MKKIVKSENYNYIFDNETGFFARWGKTANEDPVMSPFGPEIADIEVSTICSGIGTPCPWCYKSNTPKGENMTYEQFVSIFNKLPKNLTQIAFGIGDIDGNPDLFRMFQYCRNNLHNTVVPNVTINGARLSEEYAEKLATLCGACAVSSYNDDDVCFNAINKLHYYGLRQINIHKLLAEETYDECLSLIEKAASDERLVGKLNAIVFLMLKPKGKRNKFHALSSLEKFGNLMEKARTLGVSVGMDSCSAPSFLKSCGGTEKYNLNSVEPCESTVFSIYINVDGEVFPCSFTEGNPGWEKGISMKDVKDFLKDVWFSERLAEWRKKLLASSSLCECQYKSLCRSCPEFNVSLCKE